MENHQEMRLNVKKVAAGIVLYNPDLTRLKENIDSIYSQTDFIVLVDNKSDNIGLIEKMFANYSKIVMIYNEQNMGISTALNQVMGYCESRNFDWVLTLDQDSVCPPNMIVEYSKYLDLPKIAIIAPVICDINSSKKTKRTKVESKYSMIDKCITSGSLTNVSIWKKIGGFDEKMFIDFVDFDYCKRVSLNGYKIIRVNSVEMLHEIGHITRHMFLFWEIDIKNHSATRKYYISRNILYYAYKHRKFGDILIAYLRVLKLLGLTIIYEDNKYDKAKAIWKGAKDGGKLLK